MSICGEIVELSSVELTPVALELRQRAIEVSGSEEEHDKRYPYYDWQRLCHVFKRLRHGRSCLEIGPGRGYLTNIIHRAQIYDRFTAIDIVPKKPIVPREVTFHLMSVGQMDFPDESFDTVICMEVLEHLDDKTLESALREIRRVCRDQLIVSVPYNEPLPLPKYHKQQFTEERVKATFPKGRCSLLLKKPVMRVPWMLIEEDLADSSHENSRHEMQSVSS